MSQYHCPYCGAPDQDIFNRREIRKEKMASRTDRRRDTKSGDRTRPRVKMQKFVKQARQEHEENCPENPANQED